MLNQTIISNGNQFYYHTQHSAVRANQRGVSNDDIIFVLDNAKPVFKQGFRFYSLKSNSKGIANAFLRDSLINLVIITDIDASTIITIYKSEKAWKKVKIKAKRLSKW